MKILVAMNTFKGCLSSCEATGLVARGFQRGFPEAKVVERPLGDGGTHTIGALAQVHDGKMHYVDVTGPLGGLVSAGVFVCQEGKTAVIESASACGLALVPEGQRDVILARSTGVGELMRWALRQGVSKIIVGVGDTGVNDGGVGAVVAAGARVHDKEGRPVPPGILGLEAASSVGFGTILRDFAGVEVIVLADVTNPFSGPEGATFVYGPQKGLAEKTLPQVDGAMDAYGSLLSSDLGRDPRSRTMTGAGGGLAGGLWAFFGARLESGSAFVMRETGLEREIQGADLVITGEGQVDGQTLRGKIPYEVAKTAARWGVPCLVIGGGLADSLLHSVPQEFTALFSSALRPSSVGEAVSNGRVWLPFLAEQLGKAGRAFALSFPGQQEITAGGVMISRGSGGRQVLFILDRFGKMALPKGHPEPGETLEQAALREVREETGINARIVGDAGDMRYRFFKEGKVIEKRVQFYFMEALGGSPRPQPGETAGVVWVDESKLETLDTYGGVLPFVRRALDAIPMV